MHINYVNMQYKLRILRFLITTLISSALYTKLKHVLKV